MGKSMTVTGGAGSSRIPVLLRVLVLAVVAAVASGGVCVETRGKAGVAIGTTWWRW